MQLRMAARRSLNGSMTVVGDIAQATGPHAPRRLERRARPTCPTAGRRGSPSSPSATASPAQIMAWPPASCGSRRRSSPRRSRSGKATPHPIRRVAPGLGPRHRRGGPASSGRAGRRPASPSSPRASLVTEVTAAPDRGRRRLRRGPRRGLEAHVTVVPVELVKGLELDAVVVVEPARIVAEERQGLRALYVALTRATKRLAVVHASRCPKRWSIGWTTRRCSGNLTLTLWLSCALPSCQRPGRPHRRARLRR